MRLMTLLAVAGLAGTAMADDCPTAADLEDGQPIYVAYADGYSIEFRKGPKGATVEWIQREGEENGYRVVSWDGVFVVDEIETSGPLNLRRTRVMTQLSNLDGINLAPEGEFHVTGQAVFADGSPKSPVDARVQTGEKQRTTIAGCEYDAVAIETTYGRNEGTVESRLSYLPALDISVPIWQLEPDGSEISAEPTYFGTEKPASRP